MTNELNALIDPTSYYAQEFEVMDLASLTQAGGKVTRVRWLGERGRWDLSYVHGVLPSGQAVTLCGLPAAYLIPTRERMGELIAWAREYRVSAKALGLLDRGNWSELR